MKIDSYLNEIRRKHETGQATEHSFRPALEMLFRSIDPTISVINEPKKSEAGMPDFLFERDGVPFGWAEAKGVEKDILRLTGYSVEQRRRYERAYPNLIYTNGIDFDFIRDGRSVHFVSIADAASGLHPRPDHYEELRRQLLLFVEQKPISIRSAAKLAEMMAAKAAIIKDEIEIALTDDPDFRSGLGGQYLSFRANLLPRLTPDEFADIYAETITYGMFAARFHDDDLATFSRQKALENLPASNPFLRGLFQYIAGPSLPKRIEYIVDDLIQLMRASDPHSLFRDFGRFTARNDPFVHFYEDFLAAYNPAKRTRRGVWYTPEPVVDFIVRAVDDVLRSEFKLADGLADSGRVTVDWDTGQNDKVGQPRTVRKTVHRVQILDPATGTGTFLAKAVQLISDRVRKRAPGKWSSYVEQDLMPRLHGFELLMASYAMCHMKLDMQLAETGYVPGPNPPRLSVWLTNALEPAEREVRDLFFQPLVEEARGASDVKRQTPIMCVIGNPPYSGESANKGAWIEALMNDYKLEPGGKERLREKNSKWISKDEHKFLRLASHYIERNGEGVLGFITSHGYLSDPTLRGMRWKMLRTFDSIRVLDLHGNANRKEAAPDGTPDKNVFDILQGVAIVVAVRRRAAGGRGLGRVFHSELWGAREAKNEALWTGFVSSGAWTELTPAAPGYQLVPRDQNLIGEFEAGIPLDKLFVVLGNGIVTKRDELCIQPTAEAVWQSMLAFRDEPEPVVRARYRIPADVRDWRYEWARADVLANLDQCNIRGISYRPFEDRFMLYTGNARGFVGWPVKQVMAHYLRGSNLGLLSPKANRDAEFAHAFVTEKPSEAIFLSATTGSNAMNMPLYLYLDEEPGQTDAFAPTRRMSNFDPAAFAALCEAAGIDAKDIASPSEDFRLAVGEARRSEVKVFDYAYGVLNSPSYRATFAPFLKEGYPRIPLPASPAAFRRYSEHGESLRRLHLMEPGALEAYHYPYVGDGDDRVAPGYPKFEQERVLINPDQFFDGVSEEVWNLRIGGYRPAEKWLRDCRGCRLAWGDIVHYQKVLATLASTHRQQQSIDLG